MLSNANTKAADARLSWSHDLGGFNEFRHTPCIVSDLPKPDLLHTMHIGSIDNLKKWIFHFMKTHQRVDKYNAIWSSKPAYHNHTPKKMSYEEVSQWNGKELKEMSPYLLGGATQTLRGGKPAQRPIYNRAIGVHMGIVKILYVCLI